MCLSQTPPPPLLLLLQLLPLLITTSTALPATTTPSDKSPILLPLLSHHLYLSIKTLKKCLMKQENQRSLYVSATPTCLMDLASDHKLLRLLVLYKIWGAAACSPQAFSIRPLPGFSLGAVSEFLWQVRRSQSVLVCLKTHEFSPRTPAHSAGLSDLCWGRLLLELKMGSKIGLKTMTLTMTP